MKQSNGKDIHDSPDRITVNKGLQKKKSMSFDNDYVQDNLFIQIDCNGYPDIITYKNCLL